MNLPISRLAAVTAASVAALLLLRAASFVPVHDRRGDSAWVRLSWSARPERIEHCRRLSDAELAERPEHMRLRLECEGRFARYGLQLAVDGAVVLVDTVEGGGLRNDRPMHVLRETPLAPGTRAVRVVLVRLDTVATPGPESEGGPTPGSDALLGERGAREQEERQRRSEEEVPPRLSLDTTVTLGAGRVLLITYDGTKRALFARSGGG
ncbi:MAG: hypothetical protein IT360_12980 [Gemmatimonadaceae bacterium]|nr:hypothetical protein [Gemmatimonadaceae bacterium]